MPINANLVELELDSKFSNNPDMNPKDLQLFYKINDNNYWPVKTGNDNKNKFYIDTSTIEANKDLYVETNCQFIYKHFVCDSTNMKTGLLRIDCPELKTAWNPDKYVIFRNGRLLNSRLYTILTPSPTVNINLKTMYTNIKLKIGDRIDVFYIESRDDGFKNVEFNKKIKVYNTRVYAEGEGPNNRVKIPYPYEAYPRNDKSFLVFNVDGYKLDHILDYNTSDDATYITLNKDRMIDNGTSNNHVKFIFPYITADWETYGDKEEFILDTYGKNSGILFFRSESIDDPSNTTGLIKFSPYFYKYNVTKENSMFFVNTTYMDPDRYNIISNDKIQLTFPSDIANCGYKKFVMIVFKEDGKTSASSTDFKLDVVDVDATTNNQTTFAIPRPPSKTKNMLIFRGTTLLNINGRCNIDYANNKIYLNSADAVPLGSGITFVFYNKRSATFPYRMDIEVVSLGEIENGVIMAGKFKRTVTEEEFLLFVDGVYIRPERYNILSDRITFDNPLDYLFTHGRADMVRVQWNKDFEEEDSDNVPRGFSYSNDYDTFVWFDEMYSPAVLMGSKDLDGQIIIKIIIDGAKNKAPELLGEVTVKVGEDKDLPGRVYINKQFDEDLPGELVVKEVINDHEDLPGELVVKEVINDHEDLDGVIKIPPNTWEYLFLYPDGKRKRFPIGWRGLGRYVKGTVRIFDNIASVWLPKNVITEEDNGIFFNFKNAPELGDYTDYKVSFSINNSDYDFATGTGKSDFLGEEYFLFPNWLEVDDKKEAFWIGRYLISVGKYPSGTGSGPMSAKGKTLAYLMPNKKCASLASGKGTGFHYTDNEEYMSVAIWCAKMSLEVMSVWKVATKPDVGTYIYTSGMGESDVRTNHNRKARGIADLVGYSQYVDKIKMTQKGQFIRTNSITKADENIGIPDFNKPTGINATSYTGGYNNYDNYTYNSLDNTNNNTLCNGIPISNKSLLNGFKVKDYCKKYTKKIGKDINEFTYNFSGFGYPSNVPKYGDRFVIRGSLFTLYANDSFNNYWPGTYASDYYYFARLSRDMS